MKNRRLALVAFLLCACMIVGVGYAAVADELTVSGTIGLTGDALENAELNSKVYWDDADSSDDTKVDVDISADKDEVVIVADGLDTIDEEITVTATMVNTSTEYDVDVKYVLDGIDTTYYAVTIEGALSGDTTITKEGSAIVTIKIKLLAVPADDAAGADAFTITYNVTKVTP